MKRTTKVVPDSGEWREEGVMLELLTGEGCCVLLWMGMWEEEEVWRVENELRWVRGAGGAVEVQGKRSHSRWDHRSWEIWRRKIVGYPGETLCMKFLYETKYWSCTRNHPLPTFLLLWHKILSVDSFLPFNWVVKNEDYIIQRIHPGTHSKSVPEPEFAQH